MMKRTKADWVLLIEEQLESGMNIAEFCRIHGISTSAFYNTRSRFGYTALAAKTKENENQDTLETVNRPADLEESVPDEAEDTAFLQTEWNEEPEGKPAASVCFEPAWIAADDSFQKSRPGRAAPPGHSASRAGKEPIVFMLNGIELVIPSQVSQANLGRIVQACVQS